MQTVKIVKIIEGWHMAMRHKLRESLAAQRLKSGEVIVAFNNNFSMARFIDCEGGIHDYYADRGTMFDVDILSEWVSNAIGLQLSVGKTEAVHAANLRLVDISKVA